MVRFDPLFEFDAPQTYRDVSAPLSPLPAGEHDPWFDRVHPEHSRPGAELSRELEAKLQEQEQLKDDKENQRPVASDSRTIATPRNKQLKSENKEKKEKEKKEIRSLKEMRATHEPFQGKKEQKQEQSRRKPLVDVGNWPDVRRKRERAAMATSKEKKEMKDLQELLTRHNKKFKATHTYEPPQHSVRVVRQWERETKKSYYALSAEERVQANQEIAVWKKRQAEASH